MNTSKENVIKQDVQKSGAKSRPSEFITNTSWSKRSSVKKTT